MLPLLCSLEMRKINVHAIIIPVIGAKSLSRESGGKICMYLWLVGLLASNGP